jgi:hypothetical protein
MNYSAKNNSGKCLQKKYLIFSVIALICLFCIFSFLWAMNTLAADNRGYQNNNYANNFSYNYCDNIDNANYNCGQYCTNYNGICYNEQCPNYQQNCQYQNNSDINNNGGYGHKGGNGRHNNYRNSCFYDNEYQNVCPNYEDCPRR